MSKTWFMDGAVAKAEDWHPTYNDTSARVEGVELVVCCVGATSEQNVDTEVRIPLWVVRELLRVAGA